MSATDAPAPAGPVGIGGWLLVPIVGFFGVIIRTVLNVLQPGLSDLVRELASDETGVVRSLRWPIALSTLSAAAVIASAVACLVLLFRKKRAIVPAAALHYLTYVAANLADLWGEVRMRALGIEEAIDPAAIKGVAQAVVLAAVWITYFRVSRRVRNTCVR